MSAAEIDLDGELLPAEHLVRRSRVRGRTVSIKRLSKRDLDRGHLEAAEALRSVDEAQRERPATRADCLPGGRNAERPCPYVSCAYHLALDVNPRSGAIKQNFPDREVWELPETCALDVADRGGVTLEEVGAITNLVRERIRQLEVRACASAAGTSEARRAAELGGVSTGPVAAERPEVREESGPEVRALDEFVVRCGGGDSVPWESW
jgi:hypothetical protein